MQDKIIKYLPPIETLTGEITDTYATIVDVETTGLEDDCEITEICFLRIYFDDEFQITAVDEPKSFFNQPSKPIPAETVEYTGITDEMVKGHHLSDSDIIDAIGESMIVISHKAEFDRRVIERFHTVPDYYWGCSLNDIDWRSKNISVRTLDYIAFRYGFYFNPHRAKDDCLALVNVLSYDGNFATIMLRTLAPQFIIHFVNTKFGEKDIFKKEGGLWDASLKAWYFPNVIEDDLEPIVALEKQMSAGEMIINELNPLERFK